MSDELMEEKEQKQKKSVTERGMDVAQKAKDVKQTVDKAQKAAKAAKSAKTAASSSKILTALGPALPYIGIALLVILIIIFLVGIIVFLVTMPGMVMEQLKGLFRELGSKVAAFFGGDTTKQIEDEEVYEVLDYLEDMGYDLKGYGFLTQYVKETDMDPTTQELDNGVVRGQESGKIEKASSEFILTYIMSDNYVYTVKNFNIINEAANKGGFWSTIWGGIVAIGQKIAGIFVDEGALWGKGMIYLEDMHGNEWQDGFHREHWWQLIPTYEAIEVDVERRVLSITRGAFADAFEYSLEGWTGRYGMPLEFLLSVHIATIMPDLAYDMVSFFPTEVVIRMAKATADLKSAYKNPNGSYAMYDEMLATKEEGWFFMDNWILSAAEAFTILEKGLESPDTCSSIASTGEKCSYHAQHNTGEVTEACGNCKTHVDKVMGAAKDFNKDNMDTYTPYIRRVQDHWYRNVYLEIDDDQKVDAVIDDEEYEVFMKERWTKYEVYEDDDEFAGLDIWYIVGKDGKFITSDAESARIVNENTLPMDASKVIAGKDGYLYYHVETAKEAKDVGFSVARMAETEEVSGATWSAYEEGNFSETSSWVEAYPGSDDAIKKNIFYQTTTNSTKKQVEEGIRGVTNERIKRIFGTNTYFRYDGNSETAEIIYALRNDNDLGYGNLNGDKGGDSTSLRSDVRGLSFGDKSTLTANLEKSANVTLPDTTEAKTYYVKDFAGQVDLNKDSLAAFSMLENTHTVDSDYIYKDFKELIVELGFFEKEELSENVPEIFQWFIPELGSYGYPIRHADKRENMYGTMAHSYDDYLALEALSLTKLDSDEPVATATTGEGGNTTQPGEAPSGEGGTSYNQGEGGSSEVSTKTGKGVSASMVSIEEFLATTREMCEFINAEGYDYCVIHAEPGKGDYRGDCTCESFSACVSAYEADPKGWVCNSTGCPCETNHCKHYPRRNDCSLPKTFEASKQPGKQNFCCATLVSWALQNVGVMPDADHTDGAESLASYVENTLGAKRIEKSEELEPGDILVYFGHVDLVGEEKDGGFVKYNGGHQVPTGSVEGGGKDQHGGGSCIEHITGWPEKAEYALRLDWGGRQPGVWEGYKGNEAVVSPATGILLEYGEYTGLNPAYAALTNNQLMAVGEVSPEAGAGGNATENITSEEKGDRLNYDLRYPYAGMAEAGLANSDGTAGENTEPPANPDPNGANSKIQPREVYDKVGYAKILVLDDEYFKKLELALGTPFGDSLQLKNGYKDLQDLTPDDLKEWTAEQINLYGYKEFVEKYRKFDLGGYIIYIDGFECELPDPAFDPETSDSIPDGEDLSMAYFENNASDYEESQYEAGEAVQMSSEKATERYKAEESVKAESHPLILVDGELFIKEGTVIGRTRTDRETVEARGDTYTEPPTEQEIAEKKANGESIEREIIGNYIRINMRDRDDTVVENVEEYLKLDEMAPMELEMEKFLYWLGVYVEGGVKVQEGGKWVSTAVDLNDGVGATHYFGLTHYCAGTAQSLGYAVTDESWGQNQDMEMLINVFLARIEEDKEYVKKELGEGIDDGYLQGFISIKHNYGNLTKRGDEYKSNGSVSENTWCTYEGTQYAAALTKRRISEWKIVTEGRYTECYSDPDKDLIFDSETPFTDWCRDECGVTNITVKQSD